MTKEEMDRIREIDERIESLYAYIRDLKFERNKIILYSAIKEKEKAHE